MDRECKWAISQQRHKERCSNALVSIEIQIEVIEIVFWGRIVHVKVAAISHNSISGNNSSYSVLKCMQKSVTQDTHVSIVYNREKPDQLVYKCVAHQVNRV